MNEITFLKAMRQFHQDGMLDTEKFADRFFGKEFNVISLLQELKTRRESDLLPAAKFLSNTVDEQMVHITEEYAEVYNAAETYTYSKQECAEDLDEIECEIAFTEKNAAKHNLAEELVDLQTSCETMLEIIGLNYFDRQAVRKQVIEKNRARGYYQEAK